MLDIFQMKYEVISNTSGQNLLEKAFIFLVTTLKIFKISLRFKPGLFLGRASPMAAINSFVFRKKHIVFEDTEHSKISLLACKLFSTIIFTPESFQKDLGKKHVKIPAYKELFYLHPNYFTPNPSVLEEVGLSRDDPYIILRFVSWTAHHDFGHHGIIGKETLVKELEKYGRVLITSEKALPKSLEKYKITISPEKFHDLLYYASLYFGEGATVASEAALLGTPSIYVSSLVGTMGTLNELEHKYHLLYNYSDSNMALAKAIELLNADNIKEVWKLRRQDMLKDKIDVTSFLIDFIKNYPHSLQNIKRDPSFYQKSYHK